MLRTTEDTLDREELRTVVGADSPFIGNVLFRLGWHTIWRRQYTEGDLVRWDEAVGLSSFTRS